MIVLHNFVPKILFILMIFMKKLLILCSKNILYIDDDQIFIACFVPKIWFTLMTFMRLLHICVPKILFLLNFSHEIIKFLCTKSCIY